MKIHLGRDLDGQHGNTVTSQLDEVTVGPLGMLNILETQLGLLRIETPASERILQFRDCLKRLSTVKRFYYASFQTDELGTAATLLSWRDQWHLHGWAGVENADLMNAASQRLRDMSEIESEAIATLAPCLGERLKLIHTELQIRAPRISAIKLFEPLSNWPLAWQKTLSRLPISEAPALSGDAPQSSMLGELQSTLRSLAVGARPEKLSWRNDGTLNIVQAETELLAGRWLGQKLGTEKADTLLLAQNAGFLDEILVAANLPRHGFKESSAFRPALQVLPLALNQLWKPIDVYSLLKFLTHPVCPVPAIARSRLAEMLAASPGIGHGPAWDKTLAAIEKACRDTNYDWNTARERVRTWVEHERYDTAQGAPLSAVAERLTLIANYFRGRLNDADPTKQGAFASGQSQALACQRAISTLALQGETHIRPQQLETLVAQATAQGTTNPLLVSEIGACRTITQPGAAIETAEQVIWWQLSMPTMPESWPWSLSEQATLRNAGIRLPEVSNQLSQQAITWQKPIFAAWQQLTIILPPHGTEVHPLWLLIESLFEKERPPSIFPLENLLTTESPEVISHRPLPPRKRWWRLPENVSIPKRDKESFSSLESFLFNPYQWVLTYPAALRPSSILDVSDGFLLKGSLAHDLVERYVAEPFALTQNDNDFFAWFEPNFETLIDDEGAVLRMPGRREDLESFRRELREALLQLRGHFKSADAIKVESEIKLEGQFVGGMIEGYGDLLLTRRDGQQAIIDMKWHGGKKYPEKLAMNRHLQLAIYGELIRQKTGTWPQLAYFLISNADLIAHDRNFFPHARIVSKKNEVGDEGSAHLWQRFLKTWRWRCDQIEQGLIEVALTDDDQTQVPEDGMALEILNQAYNRYLALAGWREEE